MLFRIDNNNNNNSNNNNNNNNNDDDNYKVLEFQSFRVTEYGGEL